MTQSLGTPAICRSALARDLARSGSKTYARGESGRAKWSGFTTAAQPIAGKRAPTLIALRHAVWA